MWCDVQSPAMMGLQVAASKRKLEDDGQSLPAKVVRTEEATAGLEDWGADSTSAVLASTLLGHVDSGDEDDDDEDEEEEEEEEEYLPAGRGYQCEQGGFYEDQHYQHWQGSNGATDYYGREPPQQTIRCDENGKSYLDLGSSSARYMGAQKCCEGGRTHWCGRDAACYRQRRLAVLNISMCKLGRYRQFPDPSLRRSVLICNTLRYIEREMEQEGFFFNNTQPPPPPPVEPDYSRQRFPEVPAPEVSYTPYRPPETSQYEQNLRDLSSSGRATPFPGPTHPGHDTDSGMGDDESGRSINWGSVLSLSSQSDLDPLNNNDLYPSSPSSGRGDTLADTELGHEFDDFLPGWKLTPLSADDILKSVPASEGELDSIMHVLVGT